MAREIKFISKADTNDVVTVNAELYRQFTGLVDKNGREIYEGDIVRFPICPIHGRGADASRCVSWNDYQYTLTRLVNGKHETDYWLGYADHEIYVEKLEVIGNVYENPDLLK